ncbi:MAG: hypothetical protein NTX29_01960 [Actinobacteria bacterium]|nr:hypothetical protein [Actinomycetota bacterium]
MSADTSRSRLLVALIAPLTLVAGFVVAQTTGVRPLGGAILLVGGLWCAFTMWRAVGWWRTVVVGVAFAAAFVLSHPLGNVIGVWAAVLAAAAVVGVLAWVLGRRSDERAASA